MNRPPLRVFLILAQLESCRQQQQQQQQQHMQLFVECSTAEQSKANKLKTNK
jgi:hypothetical protein